MIVQIEDFIEHSFKGIKVIDTRSPSEFNHAHFPAAVNLPLLNDNERAIVGTTFKQQGRQAAIVKGFELVGHKFADYIKEAIKIEPQKKLLVYCWRGGLRSNIMAWLLQTSGFEVTLLKGGYKAYRNWVLNQLNLSKKIIVIGGKTGTGKTSTLRMLKTLGQQVIDLEELASHRGSAFGGIGLPEQPSNEQFENFLAHQWCHTNKDKVLYLENESRLIGKVCIPKSIYDSMRAAPVIQLEYDKAFRIQHILKEYGQFGNDILAEKTKKIAEKLGGLRLMQALRHLEEGQKELWCEMMLDYYDKQYEHSNTQRNKESIRPLECNGSSFEEVCKKIIEITKEIKL